LPLTPLWNSACSLQKTKLRNRLTTDRSGKPAIKAYNAKDDEESVDGDGASGCTAPFRNIVALLTTRPVTMTRRDDVPDVFTFNDKSLNASFSTNDLESHEEI